MIHKIKEIDSENELYIINLERMKNNLLSKVEVLNKKIKIKRKQEDLNNYEEKKTKYNSHLNSNNYKLFQSNNGEIFYS